MENKLHYITYLCVYSQQGKLETSVRGREPKIFGSGAQKYNDEYCSPLSKVDYLCPCWIKDIFAKK